MRNWQHIMASAAVASCIAISGAQAQTVIDESASAKPPAAPALKPAKSTCPAKPRCW